MKRLTACGIALVLIIAACGDDDGGSGNATAFCEDFSAFIGLGDDPAGGFEALERLADSAPQEISDSVGLLVDVVEESLSSGQLDEAPEGFLEAAAEINAFVRNTCGIDPDTGDPIDAGVRYSMSIGGAVEVEHTGDTRCTDFQGELSIDFSPDQVTGGDYRLVAPDAGLRSGDFEAFFTYEADDGTESEGALVISVTHENVEDLVGGRATGTIEGSFDGAGGTLEIDGEFACEVGIVVE